MDGASRFKRKSLLAIERRKKLGKWIWWGLVVVAVLMAIGVVVVYRLT